MMIFEPSTYLEVKTPLGRGNIWLVKEFGLECDTYYSVIIREGECKGQIFDFPNRDITIEDNYSLKRGNWTELLKQIKKGKEQEPTALPLKLTGK